MKPFTRWAIRQDNGVIAVSELRGRQHGGRWGVNPDRLHRAHNALDLTTWNPATTDASSVRAEVRGFPRVSHSC